MDIFEIIFWDLQIFKIYFLKINHHKKFDYNYYKKIFFHLQTKAINIKIEIILHNKIYNESEILANI